MRKLFLLFLILPIFAKAQTVCDLASKEKLEKTLRELSHQNLNDLPINRLVIEIGKSFISTPYVEKTLELAGPEHLVINLMGLDCTTYLESVVTLARMAEKNDFSMASFECELEHLRYRNGINQGYPSRLHYFSDWLYENSRKGYLTDLTKEIGGVAYPNSPTFMTENPKFYMQLSNKTYIEELKSIEKEIAKRSYFFIPKAEIQRLEKNIQSGDLIAITTSMNNLDMVHVGFAFEKNGRIHLMHASSKSMEVEISDKPLADYLAANKSQSGIMVARLTGF